MGTQEELERGINLIFYSVPIKPFTREPHGLLSLSQPSITPVPRALMSSSGLGEHQTCTFMQAKHSDT